MSEVLSAMATTRAERERLAAVAAETRAVDPDEALGWLASLGTLWRETSDGGRRQLATATFARIGVLAPHGCGSHRIVSVEMTDEAERRGLILALPASLEVTMVGDTGVSPSRVTSWPIRILRRDEWLAAAEGRSA